MAAPFPPEALPGAVTDPAESEAHNLYMQYGHLARLWEAMSQDPEVDLKRVYQVVLHSRKFRQWFDALQARIGRGHTAAQIGDMIAATFARKGVVWASRAAMNADLTAIYDNAGTVSTWADNNAAVYKTGFSRNIVVSDEVTTDEPVKITKTAQHTNFIASARALWA